MLNKNTRKRIDDARDILVGQLPLPSDQVELITITLIYKFMDDIDEETRALGGEPTFFKKELKDLSWQRILSNQLSADERLQKFIQGIEHLGKAKHIPELFRNIFTNTFLKFRDGRILKMFLDKINTFKYDHSEELGNAFEYLLMSMGTQGENGQFRTQRHIIDFMTEVVDPTKDDKILDPACGTGGFLISAYKHILVKNTKGYEDYRVSLKNYQIEGIPINWGDKLDMKTRDRITKNIVGYDITPLMVRLSRVNMYLHHFPNPNIHEYDTISNDNRWREKYDCILANPPFMTPKGGVQAHNRFRIKANRTEILFTDYILEHLTPNGKAGIIVPEGIIFQNSNDYKELRKWLIYEAGLWAVVSLPAKVFEPYSGVKTSILFVDRALARTRNEIVLLKVENDGFSLNTNRNPIDKNDLPAALNILTALKQDIKAKIKDEGVSYTILPRSEFEKIDSYKAAVTGWEFCRNAFAKLQAAKANCEEKLKALEGKKGADASTKRKEAKQVLKNNLDRFHEATRLPQSLELPEEEENFKTIFDERLKPLCVAYGENRENTFLRDNGTSQLISQSLQEVLDRERDYNLSIEKHLGEVSISSELSLVKLGDACTTFIDGNWIEKKDQAEKGIRLVQTGNVGEGFYIDKPNHARYISEETFKRLRCDEIFPGDVLISRLPDPVGRACMVPYLPTRMITAVDCTICRFDESVMLPEYFIALTLTDNYRAQITQNITGASRNRISRKNLSNINLPLIPLEEQQKIVAEITQYQKVIDGCNGVMENYVPAFEIDEGWERAKIGEIASLEYGYTATGKDTGEYRYLRITDIDGNGMLRSEDAKYVDYNEDAKPFLVKKNDLLIARTGATFGKCLIVREEIKAIYASFLIRIGLTTKAVLPEYFWIFTLSSDYWQQANSLVSGAGQPQFNANAIKQVKIPIPDLNEQKRIISEVQHDLVTVANCRELKSKMESKIREVIDRVWGVPAEKHGVAAEVPEKEKGGEEGEKQNLVKSITR